MPDVFISYSRDDQPAAREIADRLTAAGLSVFFDAEGVVAGSSWSDQIGAALGAAPAVLALLSTNSRRSSWVKDELQTALENKKLVIPILLDDGAKENWLWPLLASRPSLELDLNSNKAGEQLDAIAERLLAAQGSRVSVFRMATNAPPSTAARPTHWRAVALALASAAIGALVTWLLQ